MSKPKKTCRCKCGRKYRPERLTAVDRLPSGKRVFRKTKPTCVGFCRHCYREILRQIGLDENEL